MIYVNRRGARLRKAHSLPANFLNNRVGAQHLPARPSRLKIGAQRARENRQSIATNGRCHAFWSSVAVCARELESRRKASLALDSRVLVWPAEVAISSLSLALALALSLLCNTARRRQIKGNLSCHICCPLSCTTSTMSNCGWKRKKTTIDQLQPTWLLFASVAKRARLWSLANHL